MNKRNALDHPAAQLAAEITVEDVLNSEIMAWPVKRLDVSPTRDGEVALVYAVEHVAKRITPYGLRKLAGVWILSI